MTERPPERLGIELQRRRNLGSSFGDAWPPAVAWAVAGLTPWAQVEWRLIFREHRRHWQAAFHPLVGSPASGRQALFVPEPEEHIEQPHWMLEEVV